MPKSNRPSTASAIGYWSLELGHSLVIGHWSLVIFIRSFEIGLTHEFRLLTQAHDSGLNLRQIWSRIMAGLARRRSVGDGGIFVSVRRRAFARGPAPGLVRAVSA